MTRRELEVTNPEEILRILDSSRVLHLGLVDDGMPYIVPMNYGYVMEEGTPSEVFDNPKNSRTQEFLSKVLK